MFTLFLIFTGFILAFILFNADRYVGERSAIIFSILLLWPSLAVQAKRWHDRDKSAWWILINFIPFGNLWALVENGFLAGTDGENRYGVNTFIETRDPSVEITIVKRE